MSAPTPSPQVIAIFLSSPGDVKAERKSAEKVIARLNQSPSIQPHYVLRLLLYEDQVPPEQGASAQEIVDAYIDADKVDILVAILWARLGTPFTHSRTGITYPSGTVYEVTQALNRLTSSGRPRVLVYRCTRPIPPTVDAQQLAGVQNYVRDLENKGLYRTFETEQDFENALYRDLELVLQNHFSEAAPRGRPFLLRAHVLQKAGDIKNYPRKFVGRKALCDAIFETLGKKQVVLLHGLPGIGKTALAAHVSAQWLEKAFGSVLWLRAANEDSTVLAQAMARAVGVADTPAEANTEDRLRVLKELLLARGVSLVVFDAAWNSTALDAFMQEFRDEIPLLITTRHQTLHDITSFQVQELEADEGVELLAHHSGQSLRELKKNPDARALVMLLDGHPLAITIAGGYMRSRQQQADEMLPQIQNALQHESASMDGEERSVWDMMRVAVDDLPEDTREVFFALGAFPGRRFGVDLLSAFLKMPADEVSVHLGTLMQRNLLDRREERRGGELRLTRLMRTESRSSTRRARRTVSRRYHLHSITHGYASAKASQEAQARAAETCLMYLKDNLKDTAAARERLKSELDNFLRAADWALKHDQYAMVREFADLLYRSPMRGGDAQASAQAAGPLFQEAYHSEAAEVLAMAAEAARHEGDKLAEAGYLGNLGSVYRDQGRLRDAENRYKESLSLYHALGDEHGEGLNLARLGIVDVWRRRYSEGLDKLTRALPIMERLDQRWRAIILNNLGKIAREQNQRDAALAYHQQALAIARELPGQEQIEARSLRMIGTLYRTAEQRDLAIEHLEKALETARRIKDRQTEVEAQGNLGLVYRDLQDYERAEEALLAGLEMAREQGNFFDFALMRGNLGSVYMRRRQWDEARALVEEAVAIARRFDLTETMRWNLSRLGEIYEAQQEWTLARDVITEAIDMRRDTLHDVDLAADRERLARVVSALKGGETAAQR